MRDREIKLDPLTGLENVCGNTTALSHVFTNTQAQQMCVHTCIGEAVACFCWCRAACYVFFFSSLSTADLMIFNIWNGITTVGNFHMDYRETGNPLIPGLCSAWRLTRCSYCKAKDKSLSLRLPQRSEILYWCACLYIFCCCIISLVLFCSDGTNSAVREDWSEPIKAKEIKAKLIRALSLVLSAKYLPLT